MGPKLKTRQALLNFRAFLRAVQETAPVLSQVLNRAMKQPNIRDMQRLSTKRFSCNPCRLRSFRGPKGYFWRMLYLFFICTLHTPAGLAQSESKTGTELTVFVGELLPHQISGLSDMLPVFGGRYGLPFSFGTVEAEFSNSHSFGVDWTNFALSLTGQSTLFPDGSALYFGGVDTSLYRSLGDQNRQLAVGFHVGGGVILKVVRSFWLRTDAKLMSGPGVTLMVDVGISYLGF